ncbi:MAG: hypothetical protein ABR507_05035 [Actinomycetota bacterium]|nr:hypothetical protein [Actinomycetota bacterium]
MSRKDPLGALRLTAERIQRMQAELSPAVSGNGSLASAASDLASSQPMSDDRFIELVAVVSLAAEASLKMKPYAVQLIGVIALLEGFIADMQTGEGKTLTLAMAAAVSALRGNYVHVITANSYLANRDRRLMAPLFHALGIEVRSIAHMDPIDERRTACAANVIYADASQVAFDLLRDDLLSSNNEPIQRGLHTAFIDDIDFLLIDEGAISFVIAQEDPIPRQWLVKCWDFIEKLHPGTHFDVDHDNRRCYLMQPGLDLLEERFDETTLALIQAVLDANVILARDTHYLVRDGAIQVIDEFTGRSFSSLKWPREIQAAVEFKEGLALTGGGALIDKISPLELIGSYGSVSGATGTAAASSWEFRERFGLEVVTIPTNKSRIRKDYPDRFFGDSPSKMTAVIEEVEVLHRSGRPILVASATESDLQQIETALKASDLSLFSPTNGDNFERIGAQDSSFEAGVIARAGELFAITISTSMVGRGTDIVLSQDAIASGGLHVIGVRRARSRRIEEQLRGRAGRQGEPGSSAFFVSSDEEMIKRFADDDLFGGSVNISSLSTNAQAHAEEADIQSRSNRYAESMVLSAQRLQIRQLRIEAAALDRIDGLQQLIAIERAWANYLTNLDQLRAEADHFAHGSANGLPRFQRAARDAFSETLSDLKDSVGHVSTGPARVDLMYVSVDIPGYVQKYNWTHAIRLMFQRKRRRG